MKDTSKKQINIEDLTPEEMMTGLIKLLGLEEEVPKRVS